MGEYTPEQATSPSGFENYATKASGNGLITTATSVTLNADRPFATNKIEYTAQSADEIKASYRLFTPELKRAVSAQLKAAGYNVPITDKFDLKVRDAFVTAYDDFSAFAEEQGRIDPEFFTEQPFGIQEFLNLKGQGATPGGKTKTYTTIYSQDKAEMLVDTIYKDLTGITASPEEKARYAAILREEQAANPTTYNAKTGLAVEGMGAAESQKMLIDEIAGTDEAKRMRAMDGYRTLLSELGVKI
jgi:hypothetical protein